MYVSFYNHPDPVSLFCFPRVENIKTVMVNFVSCLDQSLCANVSDGIISTLVTQLFRN